MTALRFPRFTRLFPLLLAAGLAACASKAPAPVEDRAGGLKSAASAPQPAGPGYHTVKKGETLYSIAREYNQDYREVATWNNLSDLNRINEGQVLRVQPPAGQAAAEKTVASTAPVAVAAPVEQRPLDAPAPTAASGSAVKREPRVNKEAYSDAAYARLQNPGASPATAAAPVAAAGKSGDAQTEAAKPAAKETPAPAPAAGEAVIDGVTWSWPASGKVVGNFAQTKGVDIAGKAGDPVLAAADGRVVYVGSGLRGYGQMVIVKHGANLLSVYGHNQKILVKEGQNVKRGQKIAEMGKTDSDIVKLHFEVRRQGKPPVDPLDYLPKR
jgi:lipoprotein NlpD